MLHNQEVNDGTQPIVGGVPVVGPLTVQEAAWKNQRLGARAPARQFAARSGIWGPPTLSYLGMEEI